MMEFEAAGISEMMVPSCNSTKFKTQKNYDRNNLSTLFWNHFYQGSSLPSYCTKPELCFSVREYKVFTMLVTLVSTVIAAFGPPISVWTQPGCSAVTSIPSSFSSTLKERVAMFKAACGKNDQLQQWIASRMLFSAGNNAYTRLISLKWSVSLEADRHSTGQETHHNSWNKFQNHFHKNLPPDPVLNWMTPLSLLLHRASCRFTKYHTTNKCTNCMSFILNHLK